MLCIKQNICQFYFPVGEDGVAFSVLIDLYTNIEFSSKNRIHVNFLFDNANQFANISQYTERIIYIKFNATF